MSRPIRRRTFIAGLGGLAASPLVWSQNTWGAITPSSTSVLLVVDVQNCFLPGGTLAVPDGNEIIPVINKVDLKESNIEEVKGRHAAVIAIATEGDKELSKLADEIIYVPQIKIHRRRH